MPASAASVLEPRVPSAASHKPPAAIAIYFRVCPPTFVSTSTQAALFLEGELFPMSSAAISYARENQKRFLDELKDLLRIPSVSTAEEHKDDIRKAAEMVANDLKRIGFEHVETISTQGHPLVYADWLHASGKPTALCYAHYDVQPV